MAFALLAPFHPVSGPIPALGATTPTVLGKISTPPLTGSRSKFDMPRRYSPAGSAEVTAFPAGKAGTRPPAPVSSTAALP